MSSQILNPASWDPKTYFDYLKMRRELTLTSSQAQVKIALLDQAINTFERAALLRQTQPANDEKD